MFAVIPVNSTGTTVTKIIKKNSSAKLKAWVTKPCAQPYLLSSWPLKLNRSLSHCNCWPSYCIILSPRVTFTSIERVNGWRKDWLTFSNVNRFWLQNVFLPWCSSAFQLCAEQLPSIETEDSFSWINSQILLKKQKFTIADARLHDVLPESNQNLKLVEPGLTNWSTLSLLDYNSRIVTGWQELLN